VPYSGWRWPSHDARDFPELRRTSSTTPPQPYPRLHAQSGKEVGQQTADEQAGDDPGSERSKVMTPGKDREVLAKSTNAARPAEPMA